MRGAGRGMIATRLILLAAQPYGEALLQRKGGLLETQAHGTLHGLRLVLRLRLPHAM